MAGLNYLNLTKELKPTVLSQSGTRDGNMALSVIKHKINSNQSFEVENGSPCELLFTTPNLEQAFDNENLEQIERSYKNREEFFYAKDDTSRRFRVTQITRTTDLGGQSGGSSPGDPHELMTGALILQYGSAGTKGVPPRAYRDSQGIRESIIECQEFAEDVEGSIPNKEGKIAIFGDKLPEFAMAVSAANGFLRNLAAGSRVHKVYATGSSWNTVLRRYRIRGDSSGAGGHLFFGKEDYNSSDLIVEVHNSNQPVFIGISLKKKGISKSAADPTVLNKTVMGTDGLLRSLVRQGYVTAIRDYADIHKKRGQFWYDVIKETLQNPNRTVRQRAQQRLIRGNTTIPEYLADLENKIKSRRQRQHIINEAQKLGQQEMNKAVYSQYPEGTSVVNEYFRALNNMLTDPRHAQAIVISLANIIFKTDLQGYLKLRNSGPIPEFKFTLITGRGSWTERRGVQIRPAGELQEHFTSTIICDAMNNASGRNFYKVINPSNKKNAYETGATASKIYFDIFMGSLKLADMEIRYKGKINQEPQFFATISPAFKAEYKKVRGGKSGRW